MILYKCFCFLYKYYNNTTTITIYNKFLKISVFYLKYIIQYKYFYKYFFLFIKKNAFNKNSHLSTIYFIYFLNLLINFVLINYKFATAIINIKNMSILFFLFIIKKTTTNFSLPNEVSLNRFGLSYLLLKFQILDKNLNSLKLTFLNISI